MKYEVLLADDDDSVRLVLSKALTRAGHTVKATDNAQTLLKWAQAGQGDIIVTDVMMGGREVFETLPDIGDARPKMPIVVISANNTVNTALKAGRHKVFEYVPKPFDLEDVTNAVARAGQSVNPRRSRQSSKSKGLPMIGRSAAMQPVYRAVSRFSDSDLPILIQGAVGTGKDLVARLLHDGGMRRDRPFLRTNDFDNTSLTLQKVNGGDIYVDEIAELTLSQQDRLLALMTEAEKISPTVRPRIISATRKDLRKLVEKSAFRDDLMFRINVAEIRIPPLSNRDNDTYELAESFLVQASQGQTRRFESDALDILHRHEWAGNVRELENLVRRLAVLYSDEIITAEMVLQEFSKDIRPHGDTNESQVKLDKRLEEACRSLLNDEEAKFEDSLYQTALGWVEKPLIVEALRLTGGNRAKAAERLGIHRNTLRTRLKSLDIS
ncbi:two-component system nitrogen regulation response regulator GlnG [Litorimonas taeanensis]|uniref:DNA-binding transcriptional regulator NtrC n=1 Tax=Litorimonas taeanensis TaxID=568099 RepID=A0A420WJ67_9PROT|nr:sigma 54-interacting transcriptional regulator [Litorimonas taeanensis]RKQ71074.1 two-component system nitrogen regulation response regulator GlnG [Litorimonas taeanensis]